MLNAVLNKNVFSWRLKLDKVSALRISKDKLFQTDTAECLKARDAVTVRDRVTDNSF